MIVPDTFVWASWKPPSERRYLHPPKKHPMSETADGSPEQPEVTLARDLGLFDATMIGLGAMIGAGIFVLTGLAFNEAGPAAIVTFALNGIVSGFTALSYAELASAIPEAGGGYAFVRRAMPRVVGFLAGWMLWFAYTVACALYHGP